MPTIRDYAQDIEIAVRALEGKADELDAKVAEQAAELEKRDITIERAHEVMARQRTRIEELEADNAAVRGTLARLEDEATNLRRTNAALEAENARLKKPLTVEISQADLDAAAHNFPLRPNVQLGDHLSPERKAELDAMKPVDMPAFANKVLGGPKA